VDFGPEMPIPTVGERDIPLKDILTPILVTAENMVAVDQTVWASEILGRL